MVEKKKKKFLVVSFGHVCGRFVVCFFFFMSGLPPSCIYVVSVAALGVYKGECGVAVRWL